MRASGGFAVAPTERGKGTTIATIATGDGLPLVFTVECDSPVECKLVEAVPADCFLGELSGRLIGGNAYDSEAFDKKLVEEYSV